MKPHSNSFQNRDRSALDTLNEFLGSLGVPDSADASRLTDGRLKNLIESNAPLPRSLSKVVNSPGAARILPAPLVVVDHRAAMITCALSLNSQDAPVLIYAVMVRSNDDHPWRIVDIGGRDTYPIRSPLSADDSAPAQDRSPDQTSVAVDWTDPDFVIVPGRDQQEDYKVSDVLREDDNLDEEGRRLVAKTGHSWLADYLNTTDPKLQ